nr:MAG TPA: hypothetical protein [Caudoviricetes sp.]
MFNQHPIFYRFTTLNTYGFPYARPKINLALKLSQD